MQDKIVYLSGPIKDCSDKECKEWREKFKNLWGGKYLDPMVRDNRDERFTDKEIVEFDKIDISKSDVLLVYFFKPSVGTSMEILYAFEHGKMVVVVNENKEKLSPWITYHAQKVFNSIEEAVAYLKS